MSRCSGNSKKCSRRAAVHSIKILYILLLRISALWSSRDHMSTCSGNIKSLSFSLSLFLSHAHTHTRTQPYLLDGVRATKCQHDLASPKCVYTQKSFLSLSLSLSLSNKHTHIHKHTLSSFLSLTHAYTYTRTRTHTHTHTHIYLMEFARPSVNKIWQFRKVFHYVNHFLLHVHW